MNAASRSSGSAPRATFDPSQQHRRSMLAKIHVARKELNIVEDDYRQILLDQTGLLSAKDCTDAQLHKVLDALKAKGFKPKSRSPRTGQSRADHPMARKARALWLSLHHLGAVRNPDEGALEAFACRQLKVDRLQWSNQSQGYKLIEALKDMAAREGWPEAKSGLAILPLQRSLVTAILRKLVARGLADASWDIKTAAYRLTGNDIDLVHADFSTGTQLTRLAQAFGNILRESTT